MVVQEAVLRKELSLLGERLTRTQVRTVNILVAR